MNVDLDRKPEVVIVSAFGRGHWLASELLTLGLRTTLVDVSDGLGRWTPEDYEGPFGLFLSDEVTQSQRARLDEEDYSEQVDEGFVLWLRSGPIELRGPNVSYVLEKRQVSSEVQNYISQFTTLPAKTRSENVKKWTRDGFVSHWLASLAHSLASPVYAESRAAIQQGRPLPLFSPYSVRRVTRRGAEKSMALLRDIGVTVHEKASLVDLAAIGNTVSHMEVKSAVSGVIQGDQFIWALTSSETKRLSEKLWSELFHSSVAKPEWVWVRLRMDFQAAELAEALPLKFLMIEDLALPWTHANMLWVQKSSAKDSFDVWMRIPEAHRFQKGYHEDLGRAATDMIKARLPNSQPKILNYPQDYHYDEMTLGPARFCVYAEQALQDLKRRPFSNLHYSGPEVWELLDWTGQFSHQQSLFSHLRNWKAEHDRYVEKMRIKEAKENQL